MLPSWFLRFGTGREKFRESIAEGDGDDLFGGGQSRANGAYPGAEGWPDHLGLRSGEDLKQSLGDEPELDVAMAGRDLAADGVAVVLRFTVQVLVWKKSRRRSSQADSRPRARTTL